MKHKSKEFIINTPSITFWGVVSPRLVRCNLGASVKIVKLNQGVCKGKEIAYFVKIYPSEASPSWAMVMVGYTRLLIRGPFVGGALRGLANCYPSWVEVSTNVDVR